MCLVIQVFRTSQKHYQTVFIIGPYERHIRTGDQKLGKKGDFKESLERFRKGLPELLGPRQLKAHSLMVQH